MNKQTSNNKDLNIRWYKRFAKWWWWSMHTVYMPLNKAQALKNKAETPTEENKKVLMKFSRGDNSMGCFIIIDPMIPWTLCCLTAWIGLSKRKLTLAQPLVPMVLNFYFTFIQLSKCQQDEGLKVKIFNMLKFLQVLYKIEVSIK